MKRVTTSVAAVLSDVAPPHHPARFNAHPCSAPKLTWLPTILHRILATACSLSLLALWPSPLLLADVDLNGGTVTQSGIESGGTNPGINGGLFLGTNSGSLNLDGATYTVPNDRIFAGSQGILGMTPDYTTLLITNQISGFGMFSGFGGGDNFSTGFSGTFTPQTSGDHQFRWNNDDRGAMYIDLNGDNQFNGSERVGNIEWVGSGTKTLTAGIPYNFIYMTGEDGGGENNDWFFTPAGGSEMRPNASDPAQAGMWNVSNITYGPLDFSGQNLNVNADTTLNLKTSTPSVPFASLNANAGTATINGTGGITSLTFTDTNVATGSSSGISTSLSVALGPVSINDGATLVATGSGSKTATSVTLNGSTGGITVGGTFNLGTYSDGGAPKTLTLGGSGTTVMDNSAGGISAASTTFRITGGTLDTTSTALSANDPLGGATNIQLAGGKLVLQGQTTVTSGALRANLYYHPSEWNPAKFLSFSNDFGNSILTETPTQTAIDSGLGNSNGPGINYNGNFNTLFPGMPSTDHFQVAWTGNLTAPATGNYQLSSYWSDDAYSVYVDLNQNGVFEHNEKRWEGSTGYGGFGDFTLNGGQTYKVALGFAEWEGGENVGFHINGPGGLNENVNPNSPNQSGMWSFSSIAALNLSSKTISVDASSEIQANSDVSASFGALTLNNGVLTLSGAPAFSFASTTIDASATQVGISSNGTVDAGIINGNGANATFVKGGAGTLMLNTANTGLSNATFDVQGGKLIALAPSNLGGSTNVQLSGGTLWLSSTGGDVAYDLATVVSQDSTLKVGKADGGADGPLTVTLGSPGKSLTVQNGKFLTISATDNYSLNINNSIALEDNARMDVSDAGVNINILGAATLTMGNGSTLNLNAGTLTSDKALSVHNLNLNGGQLSMTGSGVNKSLYVGGTLTLNSSATILDLTGDAVLTTAPSATLNLIQGTLATDKALQVGNLTVEAGATLNRTGSGANGDVLVGDKLRLVNLTMDLTGSTLSVGNRIELDASHLTASNVLTVNSLWMNNGSTINSVGAMTVNGQLELYNGTNASFAGGLSVGDGIRMENNATLTYANPLTFNWLWMNNNSTLTAGADTTINGQIELYNGSVADFSNHTLNTNWQNVYVHGNSELKLKAGNNLNVNYLQVWDGGKITAPGATITINDHAYLQRGTYAFNIAGNQPNSYVQIVGGGIDDQNTDRDVHLTGTNTYTGETQIHDGTVMVAQDGVGLPTGSSLRFFNGAVGGSGTFSRTLGDQPGQVGFFGWGGFAGYGAPLTVSLATVADGANAPLYWNSFEQGFNNQGLYLGAAHATHDVTLTNNIEINSYAQIRTESRSTLATLSGNLTGSEPLEKQGAGTLVLAGNNSGFSGRHVIRRGTLDVGTNGAGLGTGRVDLQADNADSNNGGAILQANGTLAKDVGSSNGQLWWEDNGGGFAARGGSLNVVLNGGATIQWDSDAGFRGRRLMFGSSTANNVVTLSNNIDAQNGYRYIHVFDNPNSTSDKAVIPGSIANLWGLNKEGNGLLEVHGLATEGDNVRNYHGGTLKVVGDMRVGSAYDNPGDPRGDGGANNNFENNDDSKVIVTGNVRANFFYGGNNPNSSVDIAGNVTLRERYQQDNGTGHIGGNLQEGETLHLFNGVHLTVDGNLRIGAPSGSSADRNIESRSGARLTAGGDVKANYLYAEQSAPTSGGQLPGFNIAGTAYIQDGVDLRTGPTTMNNVNAANFVYARYGADLTINGNLNTNFLEASEWDYWNYVGGRASSIHLNGATAVIGGGSGNININANNPATGYGVLDGSATVSANYVGIHNKGKLGGTLTFNVLDKVEIGDNSVISPGNSPGTLSVIGNLQLNGGSRYLFEGGDLVDVSGDLTAYDNWNLDLLATGQRLAAGGSITLFKYGTLGSFDYSPNFDVSALITAGWLSPSFDTGTLSLSAVSGNIVLNGIQSQPSLWTGASSGPGDNNWQTAANWDLAAAPGAVLQFGGSTRTNANNNFTAGTAFGGIEFVPGAAAFTLSGNSVALFGNIANSSSNNQTININIALSQPVTVDTGTKNITLGGNISGAGGLIKTGAGTLELPGVNNYSGTTEIQAGTVSVANDNALGATGPSGATLKFNGGTLKTTAGIVSTRPVEVAAAGGTFDTNSFDSSLNGVISGSGTLTKAGPGTLSILGASNTMSGSYNVTGGKLLGNAASLKSPIALSNNSNVTFDQSSDGTYSKVISGTGSLTKEGGGILTLATAQSYSGATNVSAGTLKLQGAPPAGITFVGTQLDMGSGWRSASTAKTYDVVGNGVLGNDGWVTFDGGQNVTAPSYLNFTHIDSSYAGNGSYYQIDDPLTTPGGSPSTVYSGVTNQVFPGYGNTQNGVITFTLAANAPNVVRVGLLTDNTDDNGRFGASGFQITSGGGGDSGMTTELQTVGAGFNFNPDWVFIDIISGAGQTFSINVNGGPNGNAGIGAVSFDSVNLTGENPLPTSTPVSVAAGATLDLNGVNQQIASLSGSSGATVTNGGSTDSTLTISSSSNTTFGGAITDGPTNKISLVKSGPATQILSGSNSYTGTTTINGGKLLINGDSSAATGAITVNAGGTLGGTGIVGGATTVLDGGQLSPGASVGTLTLAADLDIAGAVSDVNSLSLIYELATPAHSDKIFLDSDNVLTIGSGLLELDDFLFSGTPTAGIYVLFDTDSEILGSLGTNLTGTINGYSATLSLANSGNDIVLTLQGEQVESVPEPATLVLAALGLVGLVAVARRVRSKT